MFSVATADGMIAQGSRTPDLCCVKAALGPAELRDRLIGQARATVREPAGQNVEILITKGIDIPGITLYRKPLWL